MLVFFSPIFVAHTKIFFGYNFVAPLIKKNVEVPRRASGKDVIIK